MNKVQELRKAIKAQKDVTKGAFLHKFFKTGAGEYGEGDEFLGLTVPQSRGIAKQFSDLTLDQIDDLLSSNIHEERLIAIFILTSLYKKAEAKYKREIFLFYLAHTNRVNNWDIVDSSAYKILGEYIYSHREEKNVLFTLAQSTNLWERRIAIISTFQFIKYCDETLTFEIAEILVHDNQDLIQKAVGWMLREVGKRCSRDTEEFFLKKHYKTMPRTALRYAIEHFPEEKRQWYLRTSK